VIASFHIVKFRWPSFLPPARLAASVPGLCFWRPLNIGGDFAWFREHPGRRHLYPRLKPDFRRWAFYGVWDEEQALEDFLRSSETAGRWREAAAETCHLWLRPLRCRGAWPGVQLLEVPEPKVRSAGPVAHLVRLDLTARGAAAMWAFAAPNLLHRLPDSEELLLGLPMVDRPYLQPVSFSLWRDRDAALRFAHQGRGHRDAVARVRRSQANLLERYSTAAFQPYRCQGSWNGRNPLHRGTIETARSA
jgi:hypothetical protein